MARELSEEEVMLDDKDPMDAIREIRREQGVAEDELPDRMPVISDSAEVRDALENEEEINGDLPKSGEAGGDDDEDSTPTEKSSQEETPEEEEVDASEKAAPENTADSGDEVDSDQSAADQEDQEKEAPAEKGKGPEKLIFRANGQDFEFTQEEILAQFETVFGQAMNYTQKMQKIAPYRKMISALEQEGITHDSLNIAIDALKGDKGAIRQLLEQHKMDAYDLTGDENQDPYTPKNYGKDDVQLDIEEITSKIQDDKEFAITTNVIDEQWDGASRQIIVKNPEMILGLHSDIQNGIYDKVAPMAMKMKVLDGNTKSDIEYYMLAGQQLAQEMAQETKHKQGRKAVEELNAEAQGAESKFEKASSEAARKRSASSTGARADRKGVIDYLDDDDEAFEEWYKKLHASI